MARFVGFVLSVSLAVLFSTTVICVKPVPVVVWQTSSLNSGGLSSVSVVETLTKDEFSKDFLQLLDIRGPIIMFVEPKLCIEDFTLSIKPHNEGGQTNVFTNLQSVVKNNPASMLPSVEFPEQTVREFASGRQIVELNGKAELPNSIDHSLLVVRLPDDKNRQTALANGDKILGEYVDKMNKKYPMYTGVYTGEQNSWSDAEGRSKRHIDRHILAANQSVHVVFNDSTCYLVYFEQVSVSCYKIDSKNGKSNLQFDEPLDMTSFSDQLLSCNSNFTELQLDYKPPADNIGNITALRMIMTFELKIDGDWYMTSMNATYKIKDEADEGSNKLYTTNVWAPIDFSYHCSPASFKFDTYGANDTTTYLNINFNNFQIQTFLPNNTDLAFGVPWDCVGFFTIGIWMAIIVIAILIIILGFGIYITFVIKTMDRFDDPKGKTIAVNVND